jgi:hypothetical protein
MNSMVIEPLVVWTSAAYAPSDESGTFANGSGSGGGTGRIVTLLITTRSFGKPRSLAGSAEIFRTTSMPSTMRPMAVYWPVRAS